MDSRGVATEFFSIGLGVGLESVFFFEVFQIIPKDSQDWETVDLVG